MCVGNGFMSSQCCGYAAALNGIAIGYDCVMIPGATKKADKADLNNGAAYGFCGAELETAAAGGSVIAATVCCKY